MKALYLSEERALELGFEKMEVIKDFGYPLNAISHEIHCDCECHKPGFNVMHYMPCCYYGKTTNYAFVPEWHDEHLDEKTKERLQMYLKHE